MKRSSARSGAARAAACIVIEVLVSTDAADGWFGVVEQSRVGP